MSAKKNRDLAQELVDFLIKEDGHKVNPSPQFSEKKSSSSEEDPPTAPFFAPNTTQAKTVAAEPTRKTAFEIPLPDHKEDKSDDPPTPSQDYKLGNTQPSPQFVSQRAQFVFNEVASLMAGTEAVKVAQARISTLEHERDQLRDESEKMLTAAETLQRQLSEAKTVSEMAERKHREKIEIIEDEKAVFRSKLVAKESEIILLKKENADFQARFQNDLRKIRVRERELEARQEIMKADFSAVIHSKDEMILEMRRQLEKLHFELDNFKAKSADMNVKMNEFLDRNHRTIKALRLALSVLESTESVDDKNKKGGS